jgi:TPR repeat protein
MKYILILSVLLVSGCSSDFDKTMVRAKKGDADAQFLVAVEYQYGFNMMAKDVVEASKWMRKSASQGFPEAQYQFGLSLANGDGIPKNYSEAIDWLTKAANQGNLVHQRTLGKVYAAGEITPKDHNLASHWLSSAAKQGDALSQHELAMSLEQLGDKVNAYSWWLIAHAQGNEDAKNLLELAESMLDEKLVAEAQALAAKCYESDYKDCD